MGRMERYKSSDPRHVGGTASHLLHQPLTRSLRMGLSFGMAATCHRPRRKDRGHPPAPAGGLACGRREVRVGVFVRGGRLPLHLFPPRRILFVQSQQLVCCNTQCTGQTPQSGPLNVFDVVCFKPTDMRLFHTRARSKLLFAFAQVLPSCRCPFTIPARATPGPTSAEWRPGGGAA
jgi:hypothetical protein